MRSHFILFRQLLSGIVPLTCVLSSLLQAAPFPGGFIEDPASALPRPLPSSSTFLNLVPPRGKFSFPAPYNTEAVRLTNADDCKGADCVNFIGYSYWNNINNHVGQDSMLIFLGLDRNKGGVGPSLLQYNKLTDVVENLGPLFPDSSPLSWATGEGWYFSASMPTALYIPNQTKLLRFDVITEATTTVFDITARFGSGYYLWQAHSSADDRVHSATLRQQGTWAMLGCVAYKEDSKQLLYFPRIGDFDECQVDKSGDWLVIKENVDGKDGEDNRVINLVTGQERVLLDRAGAGGHSDLGHGYMIAADNFASAANTWKVWDFAAAVPQGVVAYSNKDWNVVAPNHVSHSNATAGPASAQYACGSSANRSSSAAANEIVCFGLAGNGKALVVAPVMTSLDASGGGDDYSSSPKGNLDVTGKYFIWSSNLGSNRVDVFLVKVPSHLLGLSAEEPVVAAAPAPATSSSVVPSASHTIAPLIWEQVVNAVANGNSLTKSGGCSGCADAGAVSKQALGSGDGFLEFTISGSQKQHYAGISVAQAGTSFAQMDHALSLQGNYAEVRENGAYRAESPLASGDVLRIAVRNGKVVYTRNGSVFYTSTVAPVYPLRAYSALLEANSSISNAMVGVALTSTTSTAIVADPVAIAWESLVNATAVTGTLTKVGGCNGCADAGAVSGQAITSGAGYMEMTVTGAQGQLWTGFSVQQAGTTAAQIDFALSLQASYAEVREDGIYRAEVAITKGDVLRIAVLNGKVSYLRNGTVFYTSTVAPAYPLRSYATLLASGSSIGNARITPGLPTF